LYPELTRVLSGGTAVSQTLPIATKNRILTITDPRGITFLTNEYDSAGRVIRQTQADGGIWIFTYTTTGSFISQTVVTDPRGNPTTYRFNSAGYLIQQTDALGQSTTFERQPGTNLFLSTTEPVGRVTRFAYDPSGNVTSITDPLGNTRTFTYDPIFNKVTSITDPLGNLTTFDYDAQGNLIAITDLEQNLKPEPDRLKTRIAYNQFGQPVSTTDPLGNTTAFTYNMKCEMGDGLRNGGRMGDGDEWGTLPPEWGTLPPDTPCTTL
jgi:YD repeat-containing protein